MMSKPIKFGRQRAKRHLILFLFHLSICFFTWVRFYRGTVAVDLGIVKGNWKRFYGFSNGYCHGIDPPGRTYR